MSTDPETTEANSFTIELCLVGVLISATLPPGISTVPEDKQATRGLENNLRVSTVDTKPVESHTPNVHLQNHTITMYIINY